MEDRGQNVDLPPEIIYEIFSRLPVKSLGRFKCVSKPWRSLIADPDFVVNYSKLAIENKGVFLRRRRLLFTHFGSKDYGIYSWDLDQFLNGNHNVDVVDGLVAAPTKLHSVGVGVVPLSFGHYCGYGLILSSEFSVKSKESSFRLINPVSKESKTLPKPPIWRLPKKTCCPYQYGLGFDYSNNEYKVIQMQDYDDGAVFNVYTLQTGSWRQIEGLFPYILVK